MAEGTRMRGSLTRHNVKRPEMAQKVLEVLKKHPEGRNAEEIGSELGISSGKAFGLIDRLSNKEPIAEEKGRRFFLISKDTV